MPRSCWKRYRIIAISSQTPTNMIRIALISWNKWQILVPSRAFPKDLAWKKTKTGKPFWQKWYQSRKQAELKQINTNTRKNFKHRWLLTHSPKIGLSTLVPFVTTADQLMSYRSTLLSIRASRSWWVMYIRMFCRTFLYVARLLPAANNQNGLGSPFTEKPHRQFLYNEIGCKRVILFSQDRNHKQVWRFKTTSNTLVIS